MLLLSLVQLSFHPFSYQHHLSWHHPSLLEPSSFLLYLLLLAEKRDLTF